MRRSIDDHLAPAPPAGDDAASDVGTSWAISICDDYDDAEPRVVLTLEPAGSPGAGVVAHLSPASARRLRVALRDALREVGEPT